MNLFQKALNKLGIYTKGQIRNLQPGWQAAAVNRLTNAWTTSTLSADSQIYRDLTILRARSRDLADNNDYARRFLCLLRTNVIGDSGILLKNKAKDPPNRNNPNGSLDVYANRLIGDAWKRWCMRGNCTVDRRQTWVDVQNVALETAARDGEALIRIVRGFDNDYGFALQPIEADVLDTDYNQVLEGGGQIRMGVELNSWREPVAYWTRSQNPNDTYNSGLNLDSRRVRIPASDILHVYMPLRPEQTRGVPWMATAMYRMNMLGKYEEAEVTASRAAASKMAFLTKTDPNAQYVGDDQSGNKLMDAEPGAIEELPFNMDLKVLDWNHPNSSYQVFMKTCLRGVAAGLNVSYNTLANDMESVNFASGKLGIESEREFWKAVQCWLINQMHNPIFSEWLKVQLVRQTVALPMSKFQKFNAPDWRPRRWSYVNPQQEVSARIQEVNSGFSSISRVLAERGLDRDELFDEIEDDIRAAESRGIKFSEINVGGGDSEDAAMPGEQMDNEEQPATDA